MTRRSSRVVSGDVGHDNVGRRSGGDGGLGDNAEELWGGGIGVDRRAVTTSLLRVAATPRHHTAATAAPRHQHTPMLRAATLLHCVIAPWEPTAGSASLHGSCWKQLVDLTTNPTPFFMSAWALLKGA
jgi:hypothetical protein